MFAMFVFTWIAIGLTMITYLLGYAAGRTAERAIWADVIGREIDEGIDEIKEMAPMLDGRVWRGGDGYHAGPH